MHTKRPGPMTPAEEREARHLIQRMIYLMGDDPTREGLKETPERVIRSWQQLFGGYTANFNDYGKLFKSRYDDVVALRDIDFASTCEHHMLPFYGKCHIAYLPNGSKDVIGVSKLARIVEAHSRKLHIQEELTRDIAQSLQDLMAPKGVAVIMEATHLCMVVRGVQQANPKMLTSCMLGSFREDSKARAEVMVLLRG